MKCQGAQGAGGGILALRIMNPWLEQGKSSSRALVQSLDPRLIAAIYCTDVGVGVECAGNCHSLAESFSELY
jgi:hypothetical protein